MRLENGTRGASNQHILFLGISALAAAECDVRIGAMMSDASMSDKRDAYHGELVVKTLDAITMLRLENRRISFYSVAQKAGVARSTLYRCEDLRTLVMEARKGSSAMNGEALTKQYTEKDLEEQLRLTILERDLLIHALETICNSDDPGSCRFAILDLESDAA